jgi:alcohol dehydrogenase (cytochrome c)
MIRAFFFTISIVFGVIAPAAVAQVKDFTPVTREMLLNPSPGDWLMYSRTYDSQRFSPLNQINRQNVGQLRMAWVRGMVPGIHENIPIVHQGIMYVVGPGAVVQALDATNGDLLWEYRRKLPDDLRKFIGFAGRNRTLGIYEDLVFLAAPDGYLLGLDARTGAVRWETQVQDYKNGVGHTGGAIVVDGKILTGRSCNSMEYGRAACFVAAHDALTGKELWKFYATAAPGEPGGDSWGNLPEHERMASPWGPVSYDPVRKLLFLGIGNPHPATRMERHHGNLDAVPRSAPADLYTGSTVALDIATGKVVWYYQHLPGDDWGLDYTHERILLRTAINPDPKEVKWIKSGIPRGQERDIVVSIGKPGGIWVNDRATGGFLWATPFPYDTPNFHISRIDVETGKTYINWDMVLKSPGDSHLICFEDTKGYWPMAYYPGKNSLYIPYNDYCKVSIAGNEMGVSAAPGVGDSAAPGVTVARPSGDTGAAEHTVARPGADPNALTGIAKVNMSTGQIQRFYSQRAPGNGAVLATAGDLIFWGDMNRRFRAFDADTGKILWESILGGIIQSSTITYSVNGKQYVAVLTGDGGTSTMRPLALIRDIKPPRGHNAIYTFALPEHP